MTFGGMYFLVFNYSLKVCTCAETKHIQLLRKLNGSGEISCFMLLVFKKQFMMSKQVNIRVFIREEKRRFEYQEAVFVSAPVKMSNRVNMKGGGVHQWYMMFG